MMDTCLRIDTDHRAEELGHKDLKRHRQNRDRGKPHPLRIDAVACMKCFHHIAETIISRQKNEEMVTHVQAIYDRNRSRFPSRTRGCRKNTCNHCCQIEVHQVREVHGVFQWKLSLPHVINREQNLDRNSSQIEVHIVAATKEIDHNKVPFI